MEGGKNKIKVIKWSHYSDENMSLHEIFFSFAGDTDHMQRAAANFHWFTSQYSLHLESSVQENNLDETIVLHSQSTVPFHMATLLKAGFATIQ